MLKFSVAADKTPGAPLLEVIALVKLAFFFCKRLPQESEKITVCSYYPDRQQACELTAADTKENSNHLHCVKKNKKKGRLLGCTDHFESLI